MADLDYAYDLTLDEVRRRSAVLEAIGDWDPIAVFPIDPTADRARRAWLPCPCCRHEETCADCQNSRNCDAHWQYLLNNSGTLVHLQCPACGHLWSADTHPRRQRGAA